MNDCVKCQIGRRYAPNGVWGRAEVKYADGRKVYGSVCPVCADRVEAMGGKVEREPVPAPNALGAIVPPLVATGITLWALV